MRRKNKDIHCKSELRNRQIQPGSRIAFKSKGKFVWSRVSDQDFLKLWVPSAPFSIRSIAGFGAFGAVFYTYYWHKYLFGFSRGVAPDPQIPYENGLKVGADEASYLTPIILTRLFNNFLTDSPGALTSYFKLLWVLLKLLESILPRTSSAVNGIGCERNWP